MVSRHPVMRFAFVAFSGAVAGALCTIAAAQPPASPPNTTGPGPFAQLCAEIDLPPLPSEPNKGAPLSIELGEIEASVLPDCRIRLFNGLTEFREKYQFVCQRGNQKAVHEWLVFVQTPEGESVHNLGSITGGTDQPNKPVARLFARANRLQFEWIREGATPHNSQLANTMIDLFTQTDRHSIRLRKAVDKQAIALNLAATHTSVPLDLANLPLLESLAFFVKAVEFTGYDPPAPGFQAEPKARHAKVGERVVLSRAGSIGTSLYIDLVDRSSGPELRIRAGYRLPGERMRPLVAQKVKTAYDRMQRTIREGTARMSEAESACPALERQIQSVASRPVDSAPEQVQKDLELRALKAQLRRAQGTVRRYSRSLPKLEASIKSMDEVVEVGKKLHNNVRFHIAVVAVDGKRSLELVRFGDGVLSNTSSNALTP